MDAKVIQAGRFDQKTTAEERKKILEALVMKDAVCVHVCVRVCVCVCVCSLALSVKPVVVRVEYVHVRAHVRVGMWMCARTQR